MNPLSCQLAAENWIWSVSEKFLYHPVRNICMLRLVISAMVSPCAGNLTRTRNASRPPHVRAFGRESNEDNWILPEGRAFVSGLGFKLRHLHVFVYWRFNLPVKGLLRAFSPCWVLIRHVENRLWSILEESKPLFFFFFYFPWRNLLIIGKDYIFFLCEKDRWIDHSNSWKRLVEYPIGRDYVFLFCEKDW